MQEIPMPGGLRSAVARLTGKRVDDALRRLVLDSPSLA